LSADPLGGNSIKEHHMNWIEIIKIISEVSITFFTAALVWATWVLAKHTKMMSDRDIEKL